MYYNPLLNFFIPGSRPTIRRYFCMLFSNHYFSFCVHSHLKHILFSSHSNLLQNLEISSSEHQMMLTWRFQAYPNQIHRSKKSPQQHAFFHRSFAQGVVGLNETQEKKGIHCLRFSQHVKKANSMQEFCKYKKRLQTLSEPNSSILHQQHTDKNKWTPQRPRQKRMPIWFS